MDCRVPHSWVGYRVVLWYAGSRYGSISRGLVLITRVCSEDHALRSMFWTWPCPRKPARYGLPPMSLISAGGHTESIPATPVLLVDGLIIKILHYCR